MYKHIFNPFLFLTGLKDDYIKQSTQNCVCGFIMHKDVIYIAKIAQNTSRERRYIGAKFLHWIEINLVLIQSGLA